MQKKEPQTAVSWRVKDSTLAWLRELAQKQDRPVNWTLNQLLDKAKAEQGTAA